MPKLSEALITEIEVTPGERDILVFDDALPGFGVRKYASGRTAFFVKYKIGRQQRKVTLGPYTRGILATMRRRAADVLAKARLGEDVSAQRQAKVRDVATLGELIPRYLAAARPNHKPRAYQEKERHLMRHFGSLHRLGLHDATRARIVLELDRILDASGPVAADRAKASLSSFFSWCVERTLIETNPAGGIGKRAGNAARERVLTESELAAVWNACGEGSDYSRIIRLLIHTGQRREEIGGLRWTEVNFDRSQIELPPSRTKNKLPHVVPLSGAAAAILREIPRREGRDLVFGTGGGGFSGWSQSKRRLDGRLPKSMRATIVNADGKEEDNPNCWRLHDLRRTFVTMISEYGFAQPHVIEAIVNHISGSKAGVAGIYNRAVYANEKRQALERWGNYMTQLVIEANYRLIA